ncbi:MAG: arginine--tRNA ligase [Prevotella sp.]|nr:arginine--tRNA ligase [Prevotella sp.]
MNIETLISQAAAEAVKVLYGMEATEKMVQLQKTRSEFEGNLTLVVFPFVKAARKSPEQTAQDIGQYLVEHCSAVDKYNVVKGFLNLSVGQGAWLQLLQAIDQDNNFGKKSATDASPLVMIEYSSPNTNKPLHLGHVRNNLLGWSLAQIMEANGNRVVKTNIVNDRGIHICKSMLAWLKWGNGETPQSSGKKGDHLIGDYYVAFDKHYREEVKQLVAQGMDEEKAKQEAPLIKEAHEMLVKWEQNDPEVRALWEKMNDWVYAGFDETYKKMGVGFDKIYYESQTYLKGKAKVEEGLAKGLFERHDDGSVWADLTGEGLDQKLLLRSDGTSVYMTQDIGTAEMRFQDYPIDKMIYVVGNEQNYHFQVLSILLDRLGFKWGKELVHFSYGMVELPNGKMKSREGTVVDADDLMQLMVDDAYKTSMELGKFDDMTEEERREIARIVGMGALKYFILKVDARKNMLFNPEESIDFNGNTGPFIQYTYARICSILRKFRGEREEVRGEREEVRGEREEVRGERIVSAQETDLSPLTPHPSPLKTDPSPLTPKEIELIQKMNEFGAAVEQAGKDYSPSGIANYCYELTKVFNQFYHDYSILNEPDAAKRAVRLVLARNVAKIIKSAMALLGIEVPERM